MLLEGNIYEHFTLFSEISFHYEFVHQKLSMEHEHIISTLCKMKTHVSSVIC